MMLAMSLISSCIAAPQTINDNSTDSLLDSMSQDNDTLQVDSLGFTLRTWSRDRIDAAFSIDVKFSTNNIEPASRTDIYSSTLGAMAELAAEPEADSYSKVITMTRQFAIPDQPQTVSEAVLGLTPNEEFGNTQVKFAMWGLAVCTQHMLNMGRWFVHDECELFFTDRRRNRDKVGDLQYTNSRFVGRGRNESVVQTSKRDVQEVAGTADEGANSTNAEALSSKGMLNATELGDPEILLRLYGFGKQMSEAEVYPTLWSAMLERASSTRENVRGNTMFYYQTARTKLSYEPMPSRSLSYRTLIRALNQIPYSMGTNLRECYFEIQRNGVAISRGEIRLVDSI